MNFSKFKPLFFLTLMSVGSALSKLKAFEYKQTAAVATLAGALGYGICLWQNKKPFKTTLEFNKAPGSSKIIVSVTEGKDKVYEVRGSYQELVRNPVCRALIQVSVKEFQENHLIKQHPFYQKIPFESMTFAKIIANVGVPAATFETELQRNGLFKIEVVQKARKFALSLSFAGKKLACYAGTVDQLETCPIYNQLSDELITHLATYQSDPEIIEYNKYISGSCVEAQQLQSTLLAASNISYVIAFPKLKILFTF